MDNTNPETHDTLACAVHIVAAYTSKNVISAGEIPALLKNIHSTLTSLSSGQTPAVEPLKPAVPVKKSVSPDYIVCLEDGKHLKMLKRYLRSHYKLTPEEYRAKWNLPHDYPMVAPNYAERRSQFAKKIGLGRTRPKTNKRRRG